MSVDINPATQTVTGSRSLRRSGSSTVLTIPPQMLQALDWDQGVEVEMTADWQAGEIVLRCK